jgi:hypothetical protein
MSETDVYALDKPGTFGIPNQILHNTITDLFKIHKTSNVPGKPQQMRPPNFNTMNTSHHLIPDLFIKTQKSLNSMLHERAGTTCNQVTSVQ